MSNYVWSRIICDVDTLDEIIIGDQTNLLHPKISFKKLIGNQDDDIDVRPVLVNKLTDNTYDLRYCQRWRYPITAIIRLIETHHNIVWYLVEENHIYVSKFYWDNSVKEDIMEIDQRYYDWMDKNPTFDDSLDFSDADFWYFFETIEAHWKNWESNDNFARYYDVDAYLVKPPLNNLA